MNCEQKTNSGVCECESARMSVCSKCLGACMCVFVCVCVSACNQQHPDNRAPSPLVRPHKQEVITSSRLSSCLRRRAAEGPCGLLLPLCLELLVVLELGRAARWRAALRGSHCFEDRRNTKNMHKKEINTIEKGSFVGCTSNTKMHSNSRCCSMRQQ